MANQVKSPLRTALRTPTCLPFSYRFGTEEESIFDEGDALLLEGGDYMLLENGDKLLLEG